MVFGKHLHKMNSHNTVQANVINGVTGQDNISDHWRQHFQHILNANDCDEAMKDEIMGNLKIFSTTQIWLFWLIVFLKLLQS